MHARLILLAGAVLWGAAGLSSCGGDSAGGTTNPTPTPTPNPNPSPSANVTLTLTSENLDLADAGQLYVYVGDAPLTRAGMAANLNENAPALRYEPGVARKTVTLQVPRGKTVTVFAIEFNTNGLTPVLAPTPILTRAPNNYFEFKAWLGDFAASPEPGVAVLTADRDRSITATWTRQAGVGFRQLGCSNKKLQFQGPGLLTFGPTRPDSAADLTSTNAFTTGGVPLLQTEADQSFLYAKQGTTLILRGHPNVREDRSPSQLKSGFIRWDGQASRCGTNITCQILIPRADSASLLPPIRMINGYSVTTMNGNPIYGCNCNPNNPNPPCQQLP